MKKCDKCHLESLAKANEIQKKKKTKRWKKKIIESLIETFFIVWNNIKKIH